MVRKLLPLLRAQYKALLLLVCCSAVVSSIGCHIGCRNGRDSLDAEYPFTTFHAAHFRPGYIYSIYVSWGPYYGEYGFLVSVRESDREYWTLSQ